jgi:ubiquinone/menaquinone biosynthesis C-methylase UbiE
MNFLYRLLDLPPVYKLSQFLLAPGANMVISRKIHWLFMRLSPQDKILDVGCGPSSWLFRENLKPVGVDLSAAYIKKYRQAGAEGVVSSSEHLPFPDHMFGSVWSIGLLHHLSTSQAKKTVQEMVRVCRKNGTVIILDAVLPQQPLVKPLAYLLRKLDRGRFVRSETEIIKLLPHPAKWQQERFTYSWLGHELMLLVFKNRK